MALLALNRRAAYLMVAGAVLCVGWLAGTCRYDSRVPFLPADRRAEWIIYPKPPDTHPHQAILISAVFRRTLNLATAASKAKLSVRAFKQGSVIINGQQITELSVREKDWKKVRVSGVAKWLRPGQNEIIVTVTNSLGPPAVWLALELDSSVLRSDPSWEVSLLGTEPEHAGLASAPPEIRRGNPLYDRDLVTKSLSKIWSALLMLLMLCLGVTFAANWLGREGLAKLPGWVRGICGAPVSLLVLVILAWVVLFSNNLSQIAPLFGFDRDGHVEYVDYILKKNALPLADEGWQMYQPPFYYMLSAAVLAAVGFTTSADAALLILRWLSALAGLAHVVFIFLCLRLLFPRQTSRQSFGLAFAGILPANLCICHHITNETLASLLVTASLYLCLRILRSEKPAASHYIAVGASLGLALLTKFSVLLAVPVIFGALAWRIIERGGPSALSSSRCEGRDNQFWSWLRAMILPLSLTLASLLAICGWHYLRVWIHFGRPVVGNWDRGLPFAWWQEPGFHTAGWFFRFGEVLLRPLFSSISGFSDGAYSTLWGDGLCSGSARIDFRPPWNYDWMNAGYLLAVLGSALLLLGAAVTLLKFLRKPTAEGFLLLGLSFAFFFGIVFMSSNVPSYAQVKAFYALPALLPVCVFGAEGCQYIRTKNRLLSALVPAGFLFGAVIVCVTFWIRVRNPVAYTTRGISLANDKHYVEATANFFRALELDPGLLSARVGLADALDRMGRHDEASQQVAQALQQHPAAAKALIQSATYLTVDGRYAEAAVRLRRALSLAPDYSFAYEQLVTCLGWLGRLDEVKATCLQGLGVNPYSPQLHLALAMASLDDPQRAAEHYRLTLALQPNNLTALNNLAWMLATNPDAGLRDGAEAVRLAELGCKLTEWREPTFIGTLSAAYAETGRFGDAATEAERAAVAASTAGLKELAARNRELLELYRVGKVYREKK